MKKQCFLFWLALVALPLMGQGVKPLPTLHVEGRWLVDTHGNHVVLHGVMDTPSAWFNSGRWGWSYDDAGRKRCIDYFEKLFVGLEQAHCDVFRLHMDPAWTNDPNSGYTWTGSQGQAADASGEADIRKFNPTRLTNYLKTLYFPIARKALNHGMYVVVRPPGVCPGNLKVGDYYQKYLLTVWDTFSKNDSIRKYAGQISIELANEPVSLKNADGQDDAKALHDYFQPIVDKIRANGFKGVIWVPGTGYQSNYRSYAKYPITGDQIGYAVHNYAGWYNNSDSHCVPAEAIDEFVRSVPVLRTNPIVITEVDWSPQNSDNFKYNEMGQKVYGNFGTWATASTSKWGKAYKAILDEFGNISMTLTGTGDFIDIDQYINNHKVVPAFKDKMEAVGVDPYEACGVACFRWYADYYQVDYPSDHRYQPYQEIPENPFELSASWFKPKILLEGSAKFAAATNTLTLKQGGCSGWRFEEEEGIDISAYKYLVINLSKNAVKNTFFRIYDSSNYTADCYKLDMGGAKAFKIELQNITNAAGEPIDLTHIRLAGFNSAGADQNLYVKEVFLSNDGVNPATAIENVTTDGIVSHKGKAYDLSGRYVANPTRGLYIIDGKKVLIVK